MSASHDMHRAHQTALVVVEQFQGVCCQSLRRRGALERFSWIIGSVYSMGHFSMAMGTTCPRREYRLQSCHRDGCRPCVGAVQTVPAYALNLSAVDRWRWVLPNGMRSVRRMQVDLSSHASALPRLEWDATCSFWLTHAVASLCQQLERGDLPVPKVNKS